MMITKTIKAGLLALSVLTLNAVHAQSLDEIIDAHLKALGGKDKLAAAKTLSIEGKVQMNGQEFPFTIKTVNKVGTRFEIEIMGDKLIQVYSVKANWALNPAAIGGSGKAEELPADAVKNSSARYELGSVFLNYKESGKTVNLIGKEMVDNDDCFRISVTTKDGDETTYFISDKSYYIVKTIGKMNVQGQQMEVETVFSDYRPINSGVVISFQRVQELGEEQRIFIYEKAEADKVIDTKIFDLPKQ
jgi:hypothetical protein